MQVAARFLSVILFELVLQCTGTGDDQGFIRPGQNHLARHSETGKKTRQTEEEVGRQHQGMDRPGVRQVPEGSGEQGKMKTITVAKSSVMPPRPSRLRD